MFQEFINNTINKAIDVDGNYGPQCVDLFNYWNDLYNNGERINCLPSGYAKSLYENRFNNGILKNFTETAINNMIEGTVVVYGDCKFAPKSHVCFFIKDNGDGTYQALQQNFFGQMYVTINNNPYDGIIGALIPNQLLNPQTKQILYLPASAEKWRVYSLDKAPVVGNECGYLLPSKFGGLEYEIEGFSQEDVAIITTRDFGKVQIYVAPSTGAIIK